MLSWSFKPVRKSDTRSLGASPDLTQMSNIWIRIISVLEIIGGISGIASVMWEFLTTPINRPRLFTAIALVVYVISLFAGIALWRGHSLGRVASIVVQAIQLPKYMSQLFIFTFSFGFDAYVYGILTNSLQPVFGFEVRFLAFNQLFVNVADAPVGFGISIPACVFLAILWKFKPKVLSQDPAGNGE